MNILFTGQAGAEKSALAISLANHFLRENGINRSVEDSTAADIIRPLIAVREVEDQKWGGFPDLRSFLDSSDDFWKRYIWRDTLARILDDLARPPIPQNQFLLIHCYYYRRGRYFTAHNAHLLRRFSPDMVVTLIDDIYDVWQRIEGRETELPEERRSHFSLEELLTWRDIEISASAQLAATLGVPHYVLAVKHPIDTFYDLVFKREEKLVVYACCAISRTREDNERREQVDEYRRRLRQHFVVLDPLSIDELLYSEDDPRWEQVADTGSFQAFYANRWPVEKPSLPSPQPVANPFGGMSPEKIKAVLTTVLNQIAHRDFALVAQSDVVPAYRPFYRDYNGERSLATSHGMDEEMTFALSLKPPTHPYVIRVLPHHPRYDYLPQHTSFFRSIGSQGQMMFFPPLERMESLPEDDTSGLDDLIQHLQTLQPTLVPQHRKATRDWLRQMTS